MFFFFLMIRRPPRSTRTETLFPYTTLFRSVVLRAISGEKTAFAYSDTLSADALLSSARVVRTIGRRGAGRQKVLSGHPPKGHDLYPAIDPVNTLSAPDKVALLERIEAMARAADPHLIQVMARSDERRVGQACVSPCRTRWLP